MQISKVALVWTQNTGAPISRSRIVPPPTPVDDREEDEGDQRLLLFRREQRARHGEHRDPDIIEQDERVGRMGNGGGHIRRPCEERSDEAIRLHRDVDRIASLRAQWTR